MPVLSAKQRALTPLFLSVKEVGKLKSLEYQKALLIAWKTSSLGRAGNILGRCNHADRARLSGPFLDLKGTTTSPPEIFFNCDS